MKKVLSIQDISCVGKCSLSVALPIISSMGVECQILPTSLLSTHTAFSSFSFLDLTDEMDIILKQFELNGFAFDSIYSGYLGSFKQIDMLMGIVDKYKTETNYVVVDPVMGDYGKLYKGFDEKFAKKMLSLCKKADVIIPNLTEACYMLDVPYKDEMNQEEIEYILKRFKEEGVKNVLLTGVSFEETKLGIALSTSEGIKYHFNDKIDAKFHGSGDIFASTFVGALMNGKSMFDSAILASKYVCESIICTLKEENHNKYGLNFEQAIPYLVKNI